MFQPLTNRIRTGAASPSNIWSEVRQFIKRLTTSGKAESVVTGMIKREREDSLRSWREAVLRNAYGPEMYQALQRELQGPVGQRVMELIAENSRYIKTVPEEWAAYITGYAQREAAKGKRPEEIEAELRKIMPDKIVRNLKCIARTECSKAQAALTQARAEHLGIKAYIWRSAKDERTRHSHLGMDGVMVFYNDPPNPEALFPAKGRKPYGKYHAGNTFNCRCYQEPVVSIDMLPESIRVHDHGKIVTMTKKQIRKKYGKIA